MVLLDRQSSRIRLAIGLLTALVLGLGLFAEIVTHLPPPPLIRRDFLTVLSPSFENNLPSWWLSTLLALSGGVLALCASAADKHSWRWWLTSAGLLLLSLDESAGLHGAVASMYESTIGIFGLGFVLPAIVVAAGAALLYLPWIRRLPARSRLLFGAAAWLYLTGALFLQFLQSLWIHGPGEQSPLSTVIDLLQKPLEILGASLLLVALLDQLGGERDDRRRSSQP
ncbi:MAG TPA: hypothetical protein ENK31_08320 [Nannocystis exedens]|nr:hypothetical protein [Nannocystis exedens]